MLADQGSQLVKGCQSANFSFADPWAGTICMGRLSDAFATSTMSIPNEKLSALQWEILCATIANSMNKSDFEAMDLITPNRLLLGRNNDRCPVVGPVMMDSYDKILEKNLQIYNSWFENWLLCHVPKLMEQPKWFRDDRHLQKGDVVLLQKQESELSSEYRYGIVDSIEIGRDGKIRGAYVRYRNHDSNNNQVTYRAVRSLIIIHSVDEVNVMQELGEIAIAVDAENARQ